MTDTMTNGKDWAASPPPPPEATIRGKALEEAARIADFFQNKRREALNAIGGKAAPEIGGPTWARIDEAQGIATAIRSLIGTAPQKEKAAPSPQGSETKGAHKVLHGHAYAADDYNEPAICPKCKLLISTTNGSGFVCRFGSECEAYTTVPSPTQGAESDSRQGAAPSARERKPLDNAAIEARGWPEDWPHRHLSTCGTCKQTFLGHKRRVRCKPCATSPAANAAVPATQGAALTKGEADGRWRKKPVVIDAFQLGIDPMPDWFMDRVTANDVTLHRGRVTLDNGRNPIDETLCSIHTLEGSMAGSHGDYIIRGVKGEIYPCKPDIFAATYEAAPVQEAETVGAVDGQMSATEREDALALCERIYDMRRPPNYAIDAAAWIGQLISYLDAASQRADEEKKRADRYAEALAEIRDSASRSSEYAKFTARAALSPSSERE